MQKDRIDFLVSDWATQRPELSTEALAIALRVQSLSKTLAESLNNKFQELDLEWWEYDVLSALRRQGLPYRMSASQVAESTRLSLGAMTNRIDGLVEREFVERITDPNDRRRVYIQLSEAGRALVDNAIKARFANAMDSLAGLTRAEQTLLSDLLRKLVLSTSSPQN